MHRICFRRLPLLLTMTLAASTIAWQPPPAAAQEVADPPPPIVVPPGVPPITQPLPTPPRVVRPPAREPVETGQVVRPAEVPPGIAITVTGRVDKAGDGNVSITETSTQRSWLFGVTPATEILLNGKRAALGELEKEDAIRLTTLAEDRSVAARIAAARAEGQPTSRDPATVAGRTAAQPPRRPLGKGSAGLGVHVADSPQGVYIVEIDPASPADGVLRHGDFIMHYDRRPVTTPHVLVGWIQQQQPGEAAVLGLWRFGREFNQPITLANAQAAHDMVVEDPALNLMLAQQVKTDSRLGIVLRETGAGVQVVSVDPDSPAAQLGLRQGAVINSFNGRPVGTPFEFYREFWALGSNATTVDLGLADGVTRTLNLRQIDGFLRNIRGGGGATTGGNLPPGAPGAPGNPAGPGNPVPAPPSNPGQPIFRPEGQQPGQNAPSGQQGQQENPFRPGNAAQP